MLVTPGSQRVKVTESESDLTILKVSKPENGKEYDEAKLFIYFLFIYLFIIFFAVSSS